MQIINERKYLNPNTLEHYRVLLICDLLSTLEGMMLKLKLQYFGHLMWRIDSLEDYDAGKDWGQEEKGMTEDEMAGWHRWLDGFESEWTPGVGDGQGGLAAAIHGVTKSRTRLSDGSELNWSASFSLYHNAVWKELFCSSNKLINPNI